jgi:hypothetical protein
MTMSEKDVRLFAGFAGMMIGAFAETIQEMAKELRRHAGRDFHKNFDALEAKALRSIENAALDGIPEEEQLFLVEKTRRTVAAVFSDARKGL